MVALVLNGSIWLMGGHQEVTFNDTWDLGSDKVYQSLCARTTCEKLASPTQLETLARVDYGLVRDYLASIACLRNAQRAGSAVNVVKRIPECSPRYRW